ncbi:SIMPL domain-containing protein [Limnochorda pilosa]|uniref:DUF541 domain-containing protein n=1 Tax=Limnochorda pilosa TaxID=1555112 RepID=A0A0K2SN62_LIMPI|nr:SIMPL domain-containing protein [Limnochorda pilosa]BAS28551.1 hypothetical protein LIP_2721 [Limnochorda pilosa]
MTLLHLKARARRPVSLGIRSEEAGQGDARFRGRAGAPLTARLVGLTAALLLSWTLAGASAWAQEPAPEPIPYGKLSVEGVARRSVAPDQATIDFGVRQEATSAQAAFDSAQFVLSNIVVALKANDVPEESMRTTGLTLRPVYQHDEGEPKLVGYAAEGSVRVETKDLRRLGNLIDAAVAAGANRIENLQYARSDARSLQEELLDEAAAQALRRAERIAKALGQEVKSVAQVHEISGGLVPLGRGAAFEAAAGSAAVVLPGSLTVEVRIQVEFVLAPSKTAPPRADTFPSAPEQGGRSGGTGGGTDETAPPAGS